MHVIRIRELACSTLHNFSFQFFAVKHEKNAKDASQVSRNSLSCLYSTFSQCSSDIFTPESSRGTRNERDQSCCWCVPLSGPHSTNTCELHHASFQWPTKLWKFLIKTAMGRSAFDTRIFVRPFYMIWRGQRSHFVLFDPRTLMLTPFRRKIRSTQLNFLKSSNAQTQRTRR